MFSLYEYLQNKEEKKLLSFHVSNKIEKKFEDLAKTISLICKSF